jgi:hypothetical protein
LSYLTAIHGGIRAARNYNPQRFERLTPVTWRRYLSTGKACMIQISVEKPEIQEFIEEQVKAGRFSSPTEVIEAGIARLMLDPMGDELDARPF